MEKKTQKKQLEEKRNVSFRGDNHSHLEMREIEIDSSIRTFPLAATSKLIDSRVTYNFMLI